MAQCEQQHNGDRHFASRSTITVKQACQPGDFPFAAVHLDHPHIIGMTNGLLDAGGELRYVYDPDPCAVDAFLVHFPQARSVSFDAILEDQDVKMVACAAVNSERCHIGLQVMRAGKDYFADKPLFTNAEQLTRARKAAADTGCRYMGYFSERLHVECAVRAGELVREGHIGRVVQVIGLGPHRVNPHARPSWFFEFDQYGGILCDIGSHQLEQFLFFTGAKKAEVVSSRVANYRHKQYPGFQDFGDMTLQADNGATGYFRLDWLTPKALETWGDGRMIILGTEGFIELRKYTDLGGSREPDNLFLVNDRVNERHNLRGKVGFPFFGELILDCLNRTEKAMTQEHVFNVCELILQAQQNAVIIE